MNVGRMLARIPRARAWAGSHAEDVLGRSAVAAVVCGAAAASSSTGARALAAAVAGAVAGWHAGPALHRRSLRKTHADVRAALPDALDRLTVCVAAGMSVERALRTVAPRTPGALGEAFDEGLRALDLGLPRARAFEGISARAGDADVGALMGALTRAERYGTSVARALRAHADEMRSRARAAAEAEARTAPVKLVFPIVLCFLPAFVVLTIAPIAFSAIRTLGGI